MQGDPRQSMPLEAARGTHPNTFVRDITQPEEFKIYTDYDAYAHSTGEDENKVNLAEGQADSINVSADLSGRLPRAADSPLISPTPPTPTSGPSTHPPAQLPLPQFQPASMQVGNPTQMQAMPAMQAPNHPLPIPWHPLHETIPGMTLGWTTCNTDHRRHKRCDHGLDGRIDPVLAAIPHKVMANRKIWPTKKSK